MTDATVEARYEALRTAHRPHLPPIDGDERSTIFLVERGGVAKVWGPMAPQDAQVLRAAAEDVRRLGPAPGLVTVRDVVHAGRFVWMVMDHHVQGSLADLHAGGRRFKPADIASVGADVAQGLVHLRSCRHPHGDISPGNIVLDEHDRAGLIDFRLPQPPVTATAVATGTDPDQGRNLDFAPDDANDQPSIEDDVFALCATLHFLATGAPPRPAERDSTVDLAYEPKLLATLPAVLANAIADGLARAPHRSDPLTLRRNLLAARDAGSRSRASGRPTMVPPIDRPPPPRPATAEPAAGAAPPPPPPPDPPARPPAATSRGRDLSVADVQRLQPPPVTIGDPDLPADQQAMVDIAELAVRADEQGLPEIVGRAHLTLARRHRSRGNHESALDQLDRARRAFGGSADDGSIEVVLQLADWTGTAPPSPAVEAADPFTVPTTAVTPLEGLRRTSTLNLWLAVVEAELARDQQRELDAIDAVTHLTCPDGAPSDLAVRLVGLALRAALLDLRRAFGERSLGDDNRAATKSLARADGAIARARSILDAHPAAAPLSPRVDAAEAAVDLGHAIEGKGDRLAAGVAGAAPLLAAGALDAAEPEPPWAGRPTDRADDAAEVEAWLRFLVAAHLLLGDRAGEAAQVLGQDHTGLHRKATRALARLGHDLALDDTPSTTSTEWRTLLRELADARRDEAAGLERSVLTARDPGQLIGTSRQLILAHAVLALADLELDRRDLELPPPPRLHALDLAPRLHDVARVLARSGWPLLAAGAMRRRACLAGAVSDLDTAETLVEQTPSEVSVLARAAEAEAAAIACERQRLDGTLTPDGLDEALPLLERSPRTLWRAQLQLARAAERGLDARGARRWWGLAAVTAERISPRHLVHARARVAEIALGCSWTDEEGLRNANQVFAHHQAAGDMKAAGHWARTTIQALLARNELDVAREALQLLRGSGGPIDPSDRLLTILAYHLDGDVVSVAHGEDLAELPLAHLLALARAHLADGLRHPEQPEYQASRRRSAEEALAAADTLAGARNGDLARLLDWTQLLALRAELAPSDPTQLTAAIRSLDGAGDEAVVPVRLLLAETLARTTLGQTAALTHLDEARRAGSARDRAHCDRIELIARGGLAGSLDATMVELGLRALEGHHGLWPDRADERASAEFDEVRDALLVHAVRTGARELGAALVETARCQAIAGDGPIGPGPQDPRSVVTRIRACGERLAGGRPWVWWGTWVHGRNVFHAITTADDVHLACAERSGLDGPLQTLTGSIPGATEGAGGTLNELETERQLAGDLGAALVPAGLTALVTDDASTIVFLAPDPALRQVPHALLRLEGSGDDERLVQRCTPWVVPPLAHLEAAARRAGEAGGPPFAVVDPAGEPLHAVRGWAPTDVVLGSPTSSDPATWDRLLELLHLGAEEAVIVAHTANDDRRPSASALVLVDAGAQRGEARRIVDARPAGGLGLLYLSVCDGLGPTTRGEWSALGPSFLLSGATTVVTTTWPVVDHLQPQDRPVPAELGVKARSREIDESLWRELTEGRRRGVHPVDTLAAWMRARCESWDPLPRPEEEGEQATDPLGSMSPLWWGSLVALSADPVVAGGDEP